MNRQTIGIVALVLGWLGVHHFMLGKTFKGLMYFFFSWTTIPFFISLIEGISILLMSDTQFQQKYFGHNGVVMTTNHQISNSEQLSKLYTLYKEGVISEEEFSYQKTKLLS